MTVAPVEGVTITPPPPPPLVRHEAGGYEYSKSEEARTIRTCSCGTTFEFFGNHHLGADATLLALAEHLFEANAELNVTSS